MEYLVGAVLMFVLLIAGNIALREPKRKLDNTQIKYTQSYVYSLVAPLLNALPDEKPMLKTQATDYIQSSYVRVVILDGSAYWIKDHALFTAEVSDGVVAKETTRRVDTMAMSKVELDKTLFIVEKLREGLDNDNGGTRKPKL